MLTLETDGELLVLHVGTDVIDLGHPTREGGPGATDVEVGFVVHVAIITTGFSDPRPPVDSLRIGLGVS